MYQKFNVCHLRRTNVIVLTQYNRFILNKMKTYRKSISDKFSNILTIFLFTVSMSYTYIPFKHHSNFWRKIKINDEEKLYSSEVMSLSYKKYFTENVLAIQGYTTERGKQYCNSQLIDFLRELLLIMQVQNYHSCSCRWF